MKTVKFKTFSECMEMLTSDIEKEKNLQKKSNEVNNQLLKNGEMIVEEIANLKKIGSDISVELADAVKRVEKEVLGGNKVYSLNDVENILSNNLEMLAELDTVVQKYKKRIYDSAFTENPDYEAIVGVMYCFDTLSRFVGKYQEVTYIKPIFEQVHACQKTRDAILLTYALFKKGDIYNLKSLKIRQYTKGIIDSKTFNLFKSFSDYSLKDEVNTVNSNGFVEITGNKYVEFLLNKIILFTGNETFGFLKESGYDEKYLKRISSSIKDKKINAQNVDQFRKALSFFRNENVLSNIIVTMSEYNPSKTEVLDGFSEIKNIHVVGMVFNKDKKERIRTRKDYQLKKEVNDYNLVLFNKSEEAEVKIKNVDSYRYFHNGEEVPVANFLINYHPMIFKVNVNYQFSRNACVLEVANSDDTVAIPLTLFI